MFRPDLRTHPASYSMGTGALS